MIGGAVSTKVKAGYSTILVVKQPGLPLSALTPRSYVPLQIPFTLRKFYKVWVVWILTSLINYKVISETALGTFESVLPNYDVRSACIHHTQSHYPDTGPTRLSTKSIMPDTRRISC
ncbi:hypothetical protein ElyMa_004978400 [Elysia marginata]|uniref:Uncharacterized protein n=1 Tax=Elysia marginata TaxID=1093978 RepID=A0AAV4J774_9GAST|nr:hypothetical protein ElyMa_004978400 [Elysia marginata]